MTPRRNRKQIVLFVSIEPSVMSLTKSTRLMSDSEALQVSTKSHNVAGQTQ